MQNQAFVGEARVALQLQLGGLMEGGRDRSAGVHVKFQLAELRRER